MTLDPTEENIRAVTLDPTEENINNINNQLDATMSFINRFNQLNLFWANICPSSGTLDCVLQF